MSGRRNRRVAEARPGSKQQVSELHHRTRPPGSETTTGSDAGGKSFRTAAVVISGIELAEKIKKQQFKNGKLGGATATMPKI